MNPNPVPWHLYLLFAVLAFTKPLIFMMPGNGENHWLWAFRLA